MLDFFSIPSGCPDQAQHFVGPDLGPNCLQGLSADNKMSVWSWIQTVCKGYQLTTTKVGKELNTKKLVDTILAKGNFIWLQLSPFG